MTDRHTPLILAGFDGRESGLDAVALGRWLAETTGARLLVATVFAPINVIATASLALEPALETKLTADAETRLSRAEAVLEGFARWQPCLRGAVPPARGLHELAVERNADLIVVGSTHRHGLGRVAPGATATKLLQSSGVPVLLAPAGWRERRHPSAAHTIGAAFDASPDSRIALAAATTFARGAHARLRAICVFEVPHPANPMFAVTSHGYREIVDDMRSLVAGQLDDAVAGLPEGTHAEAEVVDGEPLEVLARESAELDLLAVGSRGYGALRSVVLGTLTEALSTRCHCPLLVIPRGAEHALTAFAATRHDRRATPA